MNRLTKGLDMTFSINIKRYRIASASLAVLFSLNIFAAHTPAHTTKASVAQNAAQADGVSMTEHKPAPFFHMTGRGPANASLTSPSALGWGNALFTSLIYNRSTVTGTDDGNWVLGVMGGDARKKVGVIIATNIDTLGLRSESFAKNGNISVRINRYLTKNTAIAIGAGNVYGWGAFHRLARSYYAAMSHTLMVGHFPVTLNGGLGTGALDSISAGRRSDDGQVRPFAGVGVSVWNNLSVIVDYTAQKVSLGGSYVFMIKRLPVFVTLAGSNLNEADGLKTRLYASVGFSVPV